MSTTTDTADGLAASNRIAIVGLACRVRGVNTPAQLWRAILDGRDTRAVVDEAALRARGVGERELADPTYVRSTRSMEGIEDFDAAFFDVTPRDARYMDPQQRVFLECCHEALESAGYPPDGRPMSVGVFAGSAASTYMLNHILPEAGAESPLETLYEHVRGNDKDHLTTTVSYKFNLTGPSMSLNTACSTGLVAVTQACKSLLAYECDMALAGGVRIELPGGVGYKHRKGNILSPDGRCFVFDARAGGTAWADGAGVVLLKRLDDALADGDHVYATIDGFATNNDGSHKAGYTSPGSEGQQGVLAEALAFAEAAPYSVGYLEAHGTGTVVGDPVEFDALSRVYLPAADGRPYCALGSAKANFGHLANAAGALGLIKATLALHHETLPPQINFERVNPEIVLDGSAFRIPTEAQAWPRGGAARRAAVSSFGIGGSNAHLVLGEGPSLAPSAVAPGARLLVLSARSEAALRAQAERLGEHLRTQSALALEDVAHTLRVGRRAHPYRAAFACRDLGGALAALTRGVEASEAPAEAPATVFMLPGQGSQYLAMGRDLHAAEPVYRAELERCLRALAAEPAGSAVRAALLGDSACDEATLRSTEVAQPAMFVVEYALARLWMSWGLRPDALIGHSLGEYVAACLAGVMTLEDALALVAARGRAMQALAGGAMLAVALGADALAPYLGEGCELAAANSPEHAVAAGPDAAIDALAERMLRDGVAAKRLDTSHAFHCAAVETAGPALRAAFARVRLSPPTLAYVSNVSGDWITAEQATSVDYWIAHMRGTVRFGDGVAAIARRHARALWIEAGPGAALSQLARKQVAAPSRIVDSLRESAADEHAHLLDALGACWVAGAAADWSALAATAPGRRVPLPTYAFERTRHWIDPAAPAQEWAAAAQTRASLEDWFHLRSWQSSPALSAPPTPPRRCLVFCDAASEGLAAALAAQGHEVRQVRPGDASAADGARYAIDPVSEDGHRHLADALRQAKWKPERAILAWGLGDGAPWTPRPERTEAALTALARFAQAFRDDDFAADARLLVLTGGAFAVVGDERLDPDAAAIAAAGLTMADELDGWNLRVVDVETDRDADWSAVARELERADAARVVAWRRGRRWSERFESARLSDDRRFRPREGGAYLLTGGLGGLGRALAGWLADAPGVGLTFVGRRELPDPADWLAWAESPATPARLRESLQALQALQARGARVRYLAADIADPRQAERAVAEAVAAFGTPDAVFHLAGAPSASVLRAKTPAEIAAGLAPKLRGALNLERALRPHRPGRIVLFSSIAAAVGGAGQFEYAAANAYLDAFAQRMNQDGDGRWLALGWDAWREAGMAANAVVPVHLERFKAEELALAIGNDDGLRALERALAEPALAHCLISPRPIAGRRRAPPRAPAPRAPALDTRGWSDTERRLSALWTELFGYERIGRHENFFDLGGDSLLATKAVAAINGEWSLDLGVRDFLESRDIADLARLVDALSTREEPAGQVEEQVW